MHLYTINRDREKTSEKMSVYIKKGMNFVFGLGWLIFANMRMFFILNRVVRIYFTWVDVDEGSLFYS